MARTDRAEGKREYKQTDAAETIVQLSSLSYSFTQHWDPVSWLALFASWLEGCGFDPQLPRS